MKMLDLLSTQIVNRLVESHTIFFIHIFFILSSIVIGILFKFVAIAMNKIEFSIILLLSL